MSKNKWFVSLLSLLAVGALILAACSVAPAKDNKDPVTVQEAGLRNPVNPVNPAQASSCTPGNAVDKTAFFTGVIKALENPSVPVSDFAVNAFLDWEPYENTLACWNPLATKWDMQVAGQTDFLTNGVKSYPDQATGILATANTLNQTWNFYQPIRTMLAKQGFDEAALKEALIKWVGSSAYADEVVAKWKAKY